jgi:putative FmdB family regulatory protein
MPTYEYQCLSCGHVMEEYQSIVEPPLKHCPKCKTDNLARIMGTGVGLIFKGSGFYLTDYKKANSVTSSSPKKEEKQTEKPAEKPKEKPGEKKE